MKIHLGEKNRGYIKVETDNGCIIENLLNYPNVNKHDKVHQDIIDNFFEAAMYVGRLNGNQQQLLKSLLFSLDNLDKSQLLDMLIDEYNEDNEDCRIVRATVYEAISIEDKEGREG